MGKKRYNAGESQQEKRVSWAKNTVQLIVEKKIHDNT